MSALLLNTSTTLGMILYNVSEYVFESELVTSLWIVLIILALGSRMNVAFSILLLALLPVVVVLMAYGWIPGGVGAVIIILSAVVLAFNFFNRSD